VLWSARDLRLPEASTEAPSYGSLLKIAAMLYKRRYLDTGETSAELKTAYLELQKAGEKEFTEMKGQAISPISYDLVFRGTPSIWRSRREDNVRALLARASSIDGGKPLFHRWPAGNCPFNAMYVFESEAIRNRMRKRLIDAQVYTPVHWPIEHGSTAAMDLSQRLLTIPVDFRCTEQQIQRIASLLVERG
jgi:hypothetical protein